METKAITKLNAIYLGILSRKLTAIIDKSRRKKGETDNLATIQFDYAHFNVGIEAQECFTFAF